MMRKADLMRWATLVVPVLVGLVAGAIMIVDYTRPAPIFCQAEGGCGEMKRTVFASFLGVKTPIWGVLGFCALGGLALARGRLARLALAVVAGLGALVAASLIAVQVGMGTFCPFCMAIDSSALVLAVVAVLRARSGWDPPESVRARALVGSAFVAAVAVTLGLGFTRKVPVPAPIAAEMALTPPGQITIVDFVDFECPFCRETHAELRPVLEAHKGKIRLVRKQVPLARIHPHAMDAARAACCGEQLGKGEAMAEALFSTPAEELTGDGCVRLAETLGLDGARFRACLSDPATEARIQADTEAFRAAAGRGLPTLFINERRLEGAQDQATLEEAVRGALGS